MSRNGITARGSTNYPRGQALLGNPLLNKGTAFTAAERAAHGLEGLLPPTVTTIDEQIARVMENYGRLTSDLDRYVYLTTLQNRNETLFFRIVLDHLSEMMPIIYTPTVGQACIEFSHIYCRSRGLYLPFTQKGRLKELMRNWTNRAKLICVTDGERILGLGDLGASGMGIPIGKLSLYTACAGLNPYYVLPITLDVGTENEKMLGDPLYIGLRQRRVRGAAYDEFVDEFVHAVRDVFPGCLIQFEDFGNTTAFHILERYRQQTLCFNDDIQGTASVSLAGMLSAIKLTGKKLTDQKLLFLGAGEAGTGIGELFVAAAREAGLTEREARERCWFVDSKGLVVASRTDLAHHKLPFAHQHEGLRDFAQAVEVLRPTAIIGVSGMPRTFTQPIVEAMARINERPIIFALSNPTSKAECTAEEAYTWSGGRAIFASGSPFAPVTLPSGQKLVPGQGNNVYIFPGVGLGALAVQAREVTDSMFLAAARTVADMVTGQDLELGRVYPSLERIREVSARIGAAVAEVAYHEGLAELPRPADLLAHVESCMWQPAYQEYA